MRFDDLWNSLSVDLDKSFRKYRSVISTLNIEMKPDKTLLTDADIEIESLIVRSIRALDPDAVIVAEEDNRSSVRTEILGSPHRVWVIDPIDGTAEFVKPGHLEFCSVVCVLEDMEPTACFIYAPELGVRRTPLSVTAYQPDSLITVNGKRVGHEAYPPTAKFASVTHGSQEPPREFEKVLTTRGYRIKTRTTSQTIDMLRTAIDLQSYSDVDLPPFSLFYRTRQKLWDGLAGMCLGNVVGLRVVDAGGGNSVPVEASLLSNPEPTFESTVMGDPEAVAWFLRLI